MRAIYILGSVMFIVIERQCCGIALRAMFDQIQILIQADPKPGKGLGFSMEFCINDSLDFDAHRVIHSIDYEFCIIYFSQIHTLYETIILSTYITDRF